MQLDEIKSEIKWRTEPAPKDGQRILAVFYREEMAVVFWYEVENLIGRVLRMSEGKPTGAWVAMPNRHEGHVEFYGEPDCWARIAMPDQSGRWCVGNEAKEGKGTP